MADERTSRVMIFVLFSLSSSARTARFRTVANGGRECAFWSAISHSQYNLKRESGYTSAFWSANPHSIKATIGAVRYTHSAEASGTISRRIGSTTLYPVEG